jgi:hypothetical protein
VSPECASSHTVPASAAATFVKGPVDGARFIHNHVARGTKSIGAPKAANIRDAINTLLTGNDEQHKEFQKAFGTGTNGKGAIRTRIELAKEAVKVAIEQ